VRDETVGVDELERASVLGEVYGAVCRSDEDDLAGCVAGVFQGWYVNDREGHFIVIIHALVENAVCPRASVVTVVQKS
jgi:hypothetical protein